MRIEHAARLTAVGVAMLGGLLLIGAGWIPNIHPDADAYWNAALRIREGLPLYGGSQLDETEIYRYAPWFAYAWVPLTYLSQETAYAIWRGILLVSAAAAIWPIIRRPTPAAITLSILVFALLVSNVPAANATGLMVGALAISIRTRAGAVVVGLAASLKIFPILLVAGFVAERRWWAALAALAVAGVAWLHVLAFGLDTLPTQVNGGSFFVGGVSLFSLSPVVWVAALLGLGGAIIYLATRRSRWTWLAASAAIPTLVPRIWLPDASYVAVSVPAIEDYEPGGQAGR